MKPHKLHRFGTILIWAGVFVWVPYFILRLSDESPSLLVFLPFHLFGVIGGARMRTTANKQLGKPVEKRRGYRRVAHYILIASILVWIPYYALMLFGRPVELTPFLIIHLIGIFSGIGLMGVGAIEQHLKGKRTDRGTG